MNDEIKEILDYLKESAIKKNLYFEINPEKAQILLNYITNLQQEKPHLHTNTEWEDLLDYKGRTYIELDRFKQVQQENETLHENNQDMQEEMARVWEENERLKEENNNKAMNDYAHAIDESWYRELYDDYKSRCGKANNQLKIIMQIIKEQPTRNIEDDEWLENRLIGVVNILQNGSDKNV